MKEQNANLDIDMLYLMKKIWNRKITIAVSAIICGLLAFLVSTFFIAPQYTATTSFYVGSQKTDGSHMTAQDLQAGDYLARDYREIILSNNVRQQVVQDLNLSMSSDQLMERIKVEIPLSTRIVSISVTSKNPETAAQIANHLRVVASEKIKTVTKIDNVEEVDAALVPTSPSSPNRRRNMVLGTLGGGLLATLVVLIIEVIDDRIRRPEDIEDVLGLPLLGVVPNTDKI